MKKVLLTFVFIAGFATVNANTTDNNFKNPEYECHIMACQYLEFAEEYGSGGNSNEAYDMAYNQFMG